MQQFETFKEFLKMKFAEDIEDIKHNPTAEKLEQIRQRLKAEVLLDISEIRKEYGRAVDKYYREVKQPFGSKDFKKDIDQFIELIGHSMFSGEKTLLDEWAIKFLKANPNVLAESLREYVDSFKDILQNWDTFSQENDFSNETQYYWSYLVRKLS